MPGSDRGRPPRAESLRPWRCGMPPMREHAAGGSFIAEEILDRSLEFRAFNVAVGFQAARV